MQVGTKTHPPHTAPPHVGPRAHCDPLRIATTAYVHCTHCLCFLFLDLRLCVALQPFLSPCVHAEIQLLPLPGAASAYFATHVPKYERPESLKDFRSSFFSRGPRYLIFNECKFLVQIVFIDFLALSWLPRADAFTAGLPVEGRPGRLRPSHIDNSISALAAMDATFKNCIMNGIPSAIIPYVLPGVCLTSCQGRELTEYPGWTACLFVHDILQLHHHHPWHHAHFAQGGLPPRLSLQQRRLWPRSVFQVPQRAVTGGRVD
jgi:hypothetical protein